MDLTLIVFDRIKLRIAAVAMFVPNAVLVYVLSFVTQAPNRPLIRVNPTMIEGTNPEGEQRQ